MAYVTLNVKNKVFRQGKHYQTSPFGMRNGRMHNGIDMIAIYYAADDVVAFADGTVYVNAFDDSRGNYVVLQHDCGAETHYYHLRSRSPLTQGTKVAKGQVLGYMGSTGNSTGPHLHFGVKINGQFVNPLPYLEGTAALPQATTNNAKSEEYIAYKVQKGDSWWQIAQNKLGNGNRYMELVRFNGYSTPPVIHPGDIVKIPCTNTAPQPAPAPQYRTHTVKPGESYWSIAEKYLGKGIRWTEIKALNGSKEVIHPGDVLKIPN
jgi:LysM repeat protein